jgi:hypothetical protein
MAAISPVARGLRIQHQALLNGCAECFISISNGPNRTIPREISTEFSTRVLKSAAQVRGITQ